MWKRNKEKLGKGGGGQIRIRMFGGWQSCGLFILLVALTVEMVASRAERNPAFQLGENQKPRTCPPPKEIEPCSCSIKTKGKLVKNMMVIIADIQPQFFLSLKFDTSLKTM